MNKRIYNFTCVCCKKTKRVLLKSEKPIENKNVRGVCDSCERQTTDATHNLHCLKLDEDETGTV